MKKLLLFLVLIVSLIGCRSHENVAYFRFASETSADTQTFPVPEPTVKVNDLLIITVNSSTPEAAIPFNLPLMPTSSATSYSFSRGNNVSYGVSMQNYLVDSDGFIVFPVLGKINVLGKTRNEVMELIYDAIHPQYIKEKPTVIVRFGSFKVSVLGEVNTPGSFPIDNERLSVLEALALAGDLTVYGRRDNVMLIRENGDKREMVRIDLRDKNLVNSPWFYLQQYDDLRARIVV